MCISKIEKGGGDLWGVQSTKRLVTDRRESGNRRNGGYNAWESSKIYKKMGSVKSRQEQNRSSWKFNKIINHDFKMSSGRDYSSLSHQKNWSCPTVPQWDRKKSMKFPQWTTKIELVHRNDETSKLVSKGRYRKVLWRSTYKDENGQARWPPKKKLQVGPYFGNF